jgi:hypothetical protein
MTTRSFSNNNVITDWTDQLNMIPNQWGMVTQMGLFVPKGISQLSYTFDKVTKGTTLLVDSNRGERSKYGKQHDRETHALPVPHFTYDDAITPNDLQGVRSDGSPDSPTGLAEARTDVLDRIARNYFATHEFAKVQALQGIVYAPNGTVNINWYTEFGITRKDVDFLLGTPTTDTLGKTEEVIAHIQDNLLSGETVSNIVALCSPEFFSALIIQERTKDAYTYYQAQNQVNGTQPLRDRMSNPMDVRSRVFYHGGITYVEYRGSYLDKEGAVQKMIPTGEAFAFPVDVAGMYQTIYAPAHRISTANTVGRPMYAYEEIIQDKSWNYESETSFLNMVTRPQAIVRLFSSN